MSRISKIFEEEQKKIAWKKAVFDLQKPSGWACWLCGHASGVLVGPAVGLWRLWCSYVGPLVEAFRKSQLNKDKQIGQIYFYLATCEHMCLYQFFTGSPEQGLKLLSGQWFASYTVSKPGNSKEGGGGSFKMTKRSKKKS
jgi:hypothetical protein